MKQPGCRSFNKGFLTSYGEIDGRAAEVLDVPGRAHIAQAEGQRTPTHCKQEERRPTLILSNDDIYNLGHYMNDVVTMWSMAVMANLDTKDLLLINFDGVRRGGPAGGVAHRLMEDADPDKHGPYIGQLKRHDTIISSICAHLTLKLRQVITTAGSMRSREQLIMGKTLFASASFTSCHLLEYLGFGTTGAVLHNVPSWQHRLFTNHSISSSGVTGETPTAPAHFQTLTRTRCQYFAKQPYMDTSFISNIGFEMHLKFSFYKFLSSRCT